MTIDLRTTYRDFSPPLEAEKRIRARLDRLVQLRPDIASCDVVAEEIHGHQLERHRYRIAIAVILSGGEILADHDHHNRHAPDEFFVAVDDAFGALERVLIRYADSRAAVG